MKASESAKIAGCIALILFLFSFRSSAQVCKNPSSRLNKLKSDLVTKDSVNRWVKNDLAFLQLQAHDTIADIGSYNGYYPSLYSVFSDSVVFYLNDVINDGFAYLDSIQVLCAKIRGSKLSDQFKIVIGSECSSALPSSEFNKVILRDALHHFKNPPVMLQDLKRIMKPQAKLVLFEPIVDTGHYNANLCKGSMTKEVFLKLMTGNGFKLSRELAVADDRYWFEFVIR
jgi:SAM-dependent methyltransferase